MLSPRRTVLPDMARNACDYATAMAIRVVVIRCFPSLVIIIVIASCCRRHCRRRRRHSPRRRHRRRPSSTSADTIFDDISLTIPLSRLFSCRCINRLLSLHFYCASHVNSRVCVLDRAASFAHFVEDELRAEELPSFFVRRTK